MQHFSIVNHIRIDSLLSIPRFADREQHPIRIEILGDSRAKGRCRLLSASHIILNHSLMEYIKILDFETGLGVSLDMAIKHAVSRKSYWRLSRTPATRYAMPNKWLEQLGLLSLKQLWCDLAPLGGTA